MEVESTAVETAPAAARSSRSLLATTGTVPDYLLAKYEVPAGCYVTRTVHVDSTLPLFQGRLPPGRIYESKTLAPQSSHSHVWHVSFIRYPTCQLKQSKGLDSGQLQSNDAGNGSGRIQEHNQVHASKCKK